MGTMAYKITNLTIVYSTVYSGADQRKHESSVSLAFVNSPHKRPVTRKIFPFDDVIIIHMVGMSFGANITTYFFMSEFEYSNVNYHSPQHPFMMFV